MKLISAFRKYFALNAGQREFIKKGKRNFNMLPGDILNFFKPLASFDEDLDGVRAQLFHLILLCIVGMLIAFVLLVSETVSEAVGGQMLLLLFVAIVFLVLFRWILGSFDLHNNLRNFAVPVINSISQDMAIGQNMFLKLDLSGKLLKSKLLTCINDDPGWFSYPKTTTWFYKDCWFACSAQLVDGSNLKIDIEDDIRQRQRKRKNPRGKIKTKTKTRIKHKITATLALKNKTYSINETPALQSNALKIKDKDRRKAITLETTLISNSTDAHLDPQPCLELVGKIFMSAVNAPSKGN